MSVPVQINNQIGLRVDYDVSLRRDGNEVDGARFGQGDRAHVLALAQPVHHTRAVLRPTHSDIWFSVKERK